MNCPNCGANNDADARFCAECGAPLENPDLEATIAGQFLLDDEGDAKTIPAGPDEIDAEAKTVAVDQAQLSAAIAEDDGVSTSEPETAPPPVGGVPVADAGDSDSGGGVKSGGGSAGGVFAAGGNDDGGRKRMMIIAGVVVILLLCCCCCALIAGIASSEDIQRELEDLVGQVTLLPSYYLAFV